MGLESIGKHISEFRHLRKLRQEDLGRDYWVKYKLYWSG